MPSYNFKDTTCVILMSCYAQVTDLLKNINDQENTQIACLIVKFIIRLYEAEGTLISVGVVLYQMH